LVRPHHIVHAPSKEINPRQARVNATIASDEENNDLFNQFFPSQDEETQARLNAFTASDEENNARRDENMRALAIAATGACIVS
jgi:hypothetical protein